MAVALRLPDSATLEPFGAKQRSTNLKVRIDPMNFTVSYSQQTQQLPRLRSHRGVAQRCVEPTPRT